ncbi:HFL141Cp [Eremothecium sinecaudum]|uniref:HFL141Cp n=1 Tax=Eremothecium sinecaudum TaxID=45286 RepID=A0A0X8HUH1_9SACH|nr:HFL141Cp [Eremothecium sinecaudum]AMD21715.1 HFL141Cp [Eremothecium sinecaudum]
MSATEYTEEQEKITYAILNKDKSSFYELLQIDREASDGDIKKAYRKLAIKLHPDKNRHPRAAEAFKRINRAFEVLSDDSKRRIYDQLGYDPDDRAAAQESYRNGGHEGSSGYRNAPSDGMFFRNTGGAGDVPDDLFSFLFNSGAGGRQFGMGGPFDFGGGTTFTFGGPNGFKVYSGPGGRFQQHHAFGRVFRDQAAHFQRTDDANAAQEPIQHMLVILLVALVFLLLPSLGF